MGRSLVCGTDLGASGERVVALAAEVARSLSLGLCLVHATDRGARAEHGAESPHPPGHDALEARVHARVESAEARLEAARAQAIAAGASVSSARVVEGRPWEVVVEESRALDARYCAVGPHGNAGRNTVLDALLGSTADQVLRHAPCPVLVAASAGAVPTLRGGVLLVAFDASDAATHALREALALAAEAGATARVAHVTGSEDTPASRAVKDAYDAALAASGAAQRPALEVLHGYPAEALAAHATEISAALVAIGTAGRKGLAHAILGSVAERLCRLSPAPVLVTRAPAR